MSCCLTVNTMHICYFVPYKHQLKYCTLLYISVYPKSFVYTLKYTPIHLYVHNYWATSTNCYYYIIVHRFTLYITTGLNQTSELIRRCLKISRHAMFNINVYLRESTYTCKNHPFEIVAKTMLLFRKHNNWLLYSAFSISAQKRLIN